MLQPTFQYSCNSFQTSLNYFDFRQLRIDVIPKISYVKRSEIVHIQIALFGLIRTAKTLLTDGDDNDDDGDDDNDNDGDDDGDDAATDDDDGNDNDDDDNDDDVVMVMMMVLNSCTKHKLLYLFRVSPFIPYR